MLVSNKEVFLIDSENVSLDFMLSVFNRNKYDSTVVVFYTDTSIGKVKNLNPIKYTVVGGNMNIEFRHCHVGNNSLDFNLVAYLGSLAESMNRGTIYIVSNDRGYDTVLHEFANNKVQVKRLSEIHGLLEVDTNSNLSNIPDSIVEAKTHDFDDESHKHMAKCIKKIEKDLCEIIVNPVIARNLSTWIYDNIMQYNLKLNCAEVRHVYVTVLKKKYTQTLFDGEITKIKSLYSKYIYTGEFSKSGVSSVEHERFVTGLLSSEKSSMVKQLIKFRIKQSTCECIADLIFSSAEVGCMPSKSDVCNILLQKDKTYTSGKAKKLVNRIYSTVRSLYQSAYYCDVVTWQRENVEINYADEELRLNFTQVVEEEVEEEESLDEVTKVMFDFIDSMKFSDGVDYSSLLDDLEALVNRDEQLLWDNLFKYSYVVRVKRDDVISNLIEYLWGTYRNNEGTEFCKHINNLCKYCKRYNKIINSRKLCDRIRNVVCDSPLAVEVYYKLVKFKFVDDIELHKEKELELENWREELIFIEV